MKIPGLLATALIPAFAAQVTVVQSQTPAPPPLSRSVSAVSPGMAQGTPEAAQVLHPR